MANASLATEQRAREDRAIYRALRIIERRAGEPGEVVTDPATAGKMFRLSLAGEDREHFEAAFLTARHGLIARERLFSGSVAGAEVYPRVVVQRALFHNAAAVLVAHNHPSGNPEPSASDIGLTQRLAAALKLVDILLLDHFIIGHGAPVSLAQRGLV
ncbi:MAG: DNA repair protein RadC [Sphingomonadales bacterium]|nr:DNA repair protein RadC [Sphingomonadales bacterium]